MIKELNRRSHPSSGSSLGHAVKTVATTARMLLSLFWCLSMGTSAVIPTLLVQTNACKKHPDADEKGSVSYAKEIYAKKNIMQKKLGHGSKTTQVENVICFKNSINRSWLSFIHGWPFVHLSTIIISLLEPIVSYHWHIIKSANGREHHSLLSVRYVRMMYYIYIYLQIKMALYYVFSIWPLFVTSGYSSWITGHGKAQNTKKDPRSQRGGQRCLRLSAKLVDKHSVNDTKTALKHRTGPKFTKTLKQKLAKHSLVGFFLLFCLQHVFRSETLKMESTFQKKALIHF